VEPREQALGDGERHGVLHDHGQQLGVHRDHHDHELDDAS
jgi:hypothetical protein